MNEHLRQKKNVRLFRNGRSQAIRIPKEFEFEGEDVEVEKLETGELVIRKRDDDRPKTVVSLLQLLRSLPEVEDVPGDPGDIGLAPLDEPGL